MGVEEEGRGEGEGKGERGRAHRGQASVTKTGQIYIKVDKGTFGSWRNLWILRELVNGKRQDTEEMGVFSSVEGVGLKCIKYTGDVFIRV